MTVFLLQMCRILPVEARQDCIEPLYNCFSNILKGADSAALEDAALRAFLGASHHLQLQTAKFILEWQPKFKLSESTERLLVDFLGTRGKRFGEKTVEIQKKRKIFAK